MPFNTEFTEDYMGIVHVGTGIVTGAEILQGCKSVTALVQTTENFHYKLVNLAGATDLQVSEDELSQIVAEDRLIAAARPHAAIAIVAPNEQITAVARHWENLVEGLGWPTHITRTASDAWRWLRENSRTFTQVESQTS